MYGVATIFRQQCQAAFSVERNTYDSRVVIQCRGRKVWCHSWSLERGTQGAAKRRIRWDDKRRGTGWPWRPHGYEPIRNGQIKTCRPRAGQNCFRSNKDSKELVSKAPWPAAGDSAPLLRSGETPPGVLRPALETSAQDRPGPLGVGPEEATKMIQGLEHLCCE